MLLLELGFVNADVVASVNLVIARRMKVKVDAGTFNDRASSHDKKRKAQGDTPREVKGVRHKLCPAKLHRDEAIYATKMAHLHDSKWWTEENKSHTNRTRYYYLTEEWCKDESKVLHAKANQLWDMAEQLSEEAGHQYNDRHGIQHAAKYVVISWQEESAMAYYEHVKQGLFKVPRTPFRANLPASS